MDYGENGYECAWIAFLKIMLKSLKKRESIFY